MPVSPSLQHTKYDNQVAMDPLRPTKISASILLRTVRIPSQIYASKCSSTYKHISSHSCQHAEILLMGDFNDVLVDTNMQAFLLACNLADLQLSFDIPTTANTSVCGRRIEFIPFSRVMSAVVGSSTLIVVPQATIGQFMLIFMNPPSSGILPQTLQHLAIVFSSFITRNRQNNIYIRSTHILVPIMSMHGTQFYATWYLPGNHSLQSLDRDITAGLLQAECHSARAPYGYLWSPRLMKLG